MGLQRHIEENYERFVESGTRTYQQIAEQADKDGATAVAEWARERAATAGKDTAPSGTGNTEPTYGEMTVKQLTELIASRPSIEVKKGWVKQQFVDALEADDIQQKAAAVDEGSYAGYSDTDLDELLELRELTAENDADRAAKIALLQAADEAAEAAKDNAGQ